MQVNENTKDFQRYARCCRVRQPGMFVFAGSDPVTTTAVSTNIGGKNVYKYSAKYT
jgi:hypothetical protein